MPETWRIRLRGLVQGVGFRPFVWKTATARGLKGWVSNGLSGLDIHLCASEAEAFDFKNFILKNAPKGSHITAHTLERAAPEFFDSFTIRESISTDEPLMLLGPDVAVCPDCLHDLHQHGNRRYGYAFVTCTYCGPRYSVIETLPYDRDNTTMRRFNPCPECLREYNDPADRRFFAQTNSCPACGVSLSFTTADGQTIATDPGKVISLAVEAWHNGRIVAVKGIGGYLLTCDATRAEAVRQLRRRKNRPDKPFALLYPDLACLEADAVVSDAARAALQSPAAPIVLLPAAAQPASGLALADIAPGLDTIGAMLPCAPLLALLAAQFGKPLVATSGNVSAAPIVYEEKDLAQLAGIADCYLSHNRDIAVPQDDSVLRCTDGGAPVVLRRSRGLAPSLLVPGLDIGEMSVIALGAEMKGTFTLSYRRNLLTSQYLGDLSDFDTQQRFERLLRNMLRLFQTRPETVLADMHPAYFSTQFGQQLALELNAPFRQVQHHEAHFAAVLAENALLQSKTPVLGVVWDGTGYGRDGNIWGGEFFRFTATDNIQRVAHWPYFPVLLGDKMPREPRLSALALLHRFTPQALPALEGKFSSTEWTLYNKMVSRTEQPQTSSMGRVFDAVACLCGFSDYNSYEGQAAMLLESAARRYFGSHGIPTESFYHKNEHPPRVGWIQHVIQEKNQPERAAALFHLSLVDMIAGMAEQENTPKIAFSGGVFQNTLLVDLIRQRLGARFEVYFHRQLSPNDESISFGQYITHHLSNITEHSTHVSCNSGKNQHH